MLNYSAIMGKSWEHRYGSMAKVEEMLKLSPPCFGIILKKKKKTVLPSMSYRVTSGLVCKAYQIAGQVVVSLYMMAVLQAYLAELLKDV